MASPTESPRPTEAHKERDLGDEYLFFDRSGDQLHVLNGTARTIYLLCDGARSRAQIASAFAAAYELDVVTAEQDTLETLDRLIELGLIH